MSDKKYAVMFEFPTKKLLNDFLGYMSDGGGEYRFIEHVADEDGQSITFDYDVKPGRRVVCSFDDDDEDVDEEGR